MSKDNELLQTSINRFEKSLGDIQQDLKNNYVRTREFDSLKERVITLENDYKSINWKVIGGLVTLLITLIGGFISIALKFFS